jgi:hypothetical protein
MNRFILFALLLYNCSANAPTYIACTNKETIMQHKIYWCNDYTCVDNCYDSKWRDVRNWEKYSLFIECINDINADYYCFRSLLDSSRISIGKQENPAPKEYQHLHNTDFMKRTLIEGINEIYRPTILLQKDTVICSTKLVRMEYIMNLSKRTESTKRAFVSTLFGVYNDSLFQFSYSKKFEFYEQTHLLRQSALQHLRLLTFECGE